MVRNPTKDHQRQGPPIHISLRTRINQRLGNQPEPVNGISPSNRWPIRTNESMGRTISTPYHRKSERMEQMATNGNGSSQQQQELHHRLRPERIADRMGTSSGNRTTLGIKEPNCGRIPIQHASKQVDGNPRPQQGRPSNGHSPEPLDDRTTHMAGREEPATSARHCQTRTPTPWPIQSHSGHLPSGGSTRTTAPVEDPPGLSHQSVDALH